MTLKYNHSILLQYSRLNSKCIHFYYGFSGIVEKTIYSDLYGFWIVIDSEHENKLAKYIVYILLYIIK